MYVEIETIEKDRYYWNFFNSKEKAFWTVFVPSFTITNRSYLFCFFDDHWADLTIITTIIGIFPMLISLFIVPIKAQLSLK